MRLSLPTRLRDEEAFRRALAGWRIASDGTATSTAASSSAAAASSRCSTWPRRAAPPPARDLAAYVAHAAAREEANPDELLDAPLSGYGRRPGRVEDLVDAAGRALGG